MAQLQYMPMQMQQPVDFNQPQAAAVPQGQAMTPGYEQGVVQGAYPQQQAAPAADAQFYQPGVPGQAPAGYGAQAYPAVAAQPEFVDYSQMAANGQAAPPMVDPSGYNYMPQAGVPPPMYYPNMYQQPGVPGTDMYGNPNPGYAYAYDYPGQYDQYGQAGQVLPYQWNTPPAPEMTPTAAAQAAQTGPRSSAPREVKPAGNRSTKQAKKSKSKKRVCC